LRQNSLLLVVPLPPPIRNNFQALGFFTLEDFTRLSPFVDYFNVMTYDFTSSPNPGPVSPANWVAQCMLLYVKDLPPQEARKFLLGINFYGMDYPRSKRSGPLMGDRYKELLQQYPDAKLSWDSDSGEHVLKYDSGGVAYYPTLHSLKLRLKIAHHLNCGAAIWDMGQGLDYFYNVF
jgi:chitinase domain-containing protein 1